MKNPVLDKIKERGYWRINFEPLVYNNQKLKLGECRDVVEKNYVQLRGWDYPHFPRRVGDDAGLDSGDKFYEGWISWWNHIEFWRMYQSGQFLHYLALRDDWSELDGWGIVQNRNIKAGETLNVVGEVIYELTEIFEFLSRLAKAGIYDEGVRISISLNNTRGRKLVMLDSGRHLSGEYKTAAESINLEKQYTKEELLTKPQELAAEIIVHVLERFGWHNPSGEVIKHDQENLLNRKI